MEDCVSLPYVETFNSKLIKRFRTWTRSCCVFSNFKIPTYFMYTCYMFYQYEHYMSISPVLHMVLIVAIIHIYIFVNLLTAFTVTRKRKKTRQNSEITIYLESLPGEKRKRLSGEKKEKANLVTPIEKNQEIRNQLVKRTKPTAKCCDATITKSA